MNPRDHVLVDLLRSGIQDLLDDPAGAITSDIGLVKWVEGLKALTLELGADWEQLLREEGSEFERERLQELLERP